MRDCPDGTMRDLLPLHVSGKLAAADAARVEMHLHTCADCAAEVDLLRAVGRAYVGVPVDVAAIAAKLPTARVARSAVPFYRQSLWRAAAAVTLMIAGTASVMVFRQTESPLTAVPDSAASAPDAPAPAVPQPRESTVAQTPSTAPRTQSTEPAISFGLNLADLTDAQLEALVKSLDRMDNAVSTEPVVTGTPIIPGTLDPAVRKNQ